MFTFLLKTMHCGIWEWDLCDGSILTVMLRMLKFTGTIMRMSCHKHVKIIRIGWIWLYTKLQESIDLFPLPRVWSRLWVCFFSWLYHSQYRFDEFIIICLLMYITVSALVPWRKWVKHDSIKIKRGDWSIFYKITCFRMAHERRVISDHRPLDCLFGSLSKLTTQETDQDPVMLGIYG